MLNRTPFLTLLALFVPRGPGCTLFCVLPLMLWCGSDSTVRLPSKNAVVTELLCSLRSLSKQFPYYFTLCVSQYCMALSMACIHLIIAQIWRFRLSNQ